MKKLPLVLSCIIITAGLLSHGSGMAQSTQDEPAISSDRTTAFRFRSDFLIDLDEDMGWAAGINQSPAQTVDTPFRIRFEVESDTSAYRRQYSLQYRWNDGPWLYAEAHEFPYPSAASPALSIVSCPAFFIGEEAGDLVDVSTHTPNPGAGISLSPTTPGWVPEPTSGASAEWEFALVVRRWTDGPNLVKDSDRFSLRMVDHLGRPLPGPTPRFLVNVPERHLGGTFVETPARIGPYENSIGHLYFIMEPTETDNFFMIVKSTDGGKFWFEADPGNRPKVGDLEGVGSVMDKHGIIHIVHQISEGVYHHAFATSDNDEAKDRWVVDSKLITAHEEPPTQVADITVRPDGSLVAAFGVGDKLQYSILKPGGTWSKAVYLTHDHPAVFTNPSLISLPDGTIDITYKSMDGIGWHRQLLPDNSLTPPQQFVQNLGTTEEETVAILPLIYLPHKRTTIAIFRQADGYLYLSTKSSNTAWSEPFKISDRTVVTNPVDSDQTGADAVAWNDKILVSFIGEEDRSIYLSVIENADQTPAARLIVPDIEGSWVRGNILYGQQQSPVYGIIYDAGSNGGSGFNKYLPLQLVK